MYIISILALPLICFLNINSMDDDSSSTDLSESKQVKLTDSLNFYDKKKREKKSPLHSSLTKNKIDNDNNNKENDKYTHNKTDEKKIALLPSLSDSSSNSPVENRKMNNPNNLANNSGNRKRILAHKPTVHSTSVFNERTHLSVTDSSDNDSDNYDNNTLDHTSTEQLIRKNNKNLVSNSAPGKQQATKNNHVIEKSESIITKKHRISISDHTKGNFHSFVKSSSSEFLIVVDMIDDVGWGTLSKNKELIVEIAKKNNLQGSNFYKIVEYMDKAIIKTNPYVLMFTNYFFYTVIQKDEFKLLIDSPLNLMRRNDLNLNQCIQAIGGYVNSITHNAITWPSVSRQKNIHQYYKELLEHNKDIDVSLVYAPYVGACITNNFLAQLDRAYNYKNDIKKIMNSQKKIDILKKQLHKQICDSTIFIGKKMIPISKLSKTDSVVNAPMGDSDTDSNDSDEK